MTRTALVALALALLAFPASGPAHSAHGLTGTPLDAVTGTDAAGGAAVASCGTAPGTFTPDEQITGSFGPEDQGSYLMVPFEVPADTDAVRIRYCYDTPALTDPQGLNKHTLDLGVYETESATDADTIWGRAEFRGWGGSSRPDTTISGEAVDPERTDKGTTDTTVGYLPGPIPAGTWAAELGVAAIGDEGPTEDGEVQWRMEIDLIDDPTYSDQPYEPTPYDETPARDNPGWYAGDFHVHARHSNPNDAEMGTVFDYAFCPDESLGARCDEAESQPGADLDFITLSDYVTTRHWDEIGKFQPDYPEHLIIRSAEAITYEGHVNNHATTRWADYRTGPINEAVVSGDAVVDVKPLRGPTPPGSPGGMFDQIHAGGGFTQINHPTIFPSAIPIFQRLCRGCPWDYTDAETDYRKVDAIEVATGPAGIQGAPVEPGPNPFTPTAIQFYERAIDANGLNSNHIAAVGSSDSHKAGGSSPTTSPVGQATTVVYADELSEEGIQNGVLAGHTYVKLWGNDGPDLRFRAVSAKTGDEGIMGDTVTGNRVRFTATVRNLEEARAARPGTYTLYVIRNGLPLSVHPLPPSGDEFSTSFDSSGPGRYRLQVEREATGVASIENVSSPIWTTGAAPGPGPGPGPGPSPGEGCDNEVSGTDGDDRLRGTTRADLIRGRAGDDAVRALGGRDCVFGGLGEDRLRGGASRDLLKGGRGSDRLHGGGGRDRLNAGRGDDKVVATESGRDRIDCGAGEDRAKVSANDVVRRCEAVSRR